MEHIQTIWLNTKQIKIYGIDPTKTNAHAEPYSPWNAQLKQSKYEYEYGQYVCGCS